MSWWEGLSVLFGRRVCTGWVGGSVCSRWVGEHVIAWRCKFIIVSV